MRPRQRLEGREFIFDVQGHFVNPSGAWLKEVPADGRPLSGMPKAACGLAEGGGDRSYLQCLGPDEFVKDVFLDSDTDMMVLSFVPSRRDAEPLTIEEADATRTIVDRMEGTHRLMLHGRVNPNQPGDIEGMDELAERGAWLPGRPTPSGARTARGSSCHDDDVGFAFIEKARGPRRESDRRSTRASRSAESYEHSQCSDIGSWRNGFRT